MIRTVNWFNVAIFAIGIVALSLISYIIKLDPIVSLIGGFVYGFGMSTVLPWVDYNY